MSDLDDIFASVESEGGDPGDISVIGRNATVHMGDDGEAGDIFDVDGESVSDETGTDDDDDLDIESDDESDDDATLEDFDFDSVKDKPVSVTVNGETFEVPLAELRNGYMRQADYTRKTQQIAADGEVVRWAKVLQDGFKNDPQAVIGYLADQYGVKPTNEPDPWQELVENDPSLAPLVQRIQQQDVELANLRTQSQTTAQEREAAAVRAELNDVQTKYSDFDPQQVIPIALQNGVRLEQAYKLWKADQMINSQQETVAAQAKAEAAAARREKAKTAKAKVSQGASKSKATSDDGWRKFDSFEDILNHELNR